MKKTFQSKDFDKLYQSIATGHVSETRRIVERMTPEDLVLICYKVSTTWYSQRKYNNILPIINQFVVKVDQWHKPVLEWLVKQKSNDLNGWLGVSAVISVTQLLGKDFIKDILSIIKDTYCDPESGYIGRDGLCEMMIMLLPYIPEDEQNK